MEGKDRVRLGWKGCFMCDMDGVIVVVGARWLEKDK